MKVDAVPVMPATSDARGSIACDCVFLLVARERSLLASLLILQSCVESLEPCRELLPSAAIEVETAGRVQGHEHSLYMLRRNSRAVRGSASII